jgi:hypothetical protein
VLESMQHCAPNHTVDQLAEGGLNAAFGGLRCHRLRRTVFDRCAQSVWT